jgi:hypothetical protein
MGMEVSMPKRSNPEQRLVTRIYQAIEATGATVLESQERCKAGLRKKREIDVVIERQTLGVTTRIAVEVRARGLKEDVTWIDCLIGKYKSLGVDKIIAVSTSGFTEAATEQANDEGIDTLTLADAEKFDWPAQFTRLGFCHMVAQDIRISFHVETVPQIPGPVDDRLPVGTQTETHGILQGLIAEVREVAQKLAAKKFMFNNLVLADIKDKVWLMEIPIPLPRPCYIHMSNGSRPEIKRFIVRLDRRFEVDIRKPRHYLLDLPPFLTQTVKTQNS